MSINWVMLDGKGKFVLLPAERVVHVTPERVSLAITTPTASYPGNKPLAIHGTSGTVHMTNQRIVYLPEQPTEDLKSFSAPILNLHDTHLTLPWFGPNGWQALLRPVPGGNIPVTQAAIELKLTFKEGGAPEFHTKFVHIKEMLHHAVSNAREGNPTGVISSSVNLENVHLDQLPSYQESGHDQLAPQVPEPGVRNNTTNEMIPSTVSPAANPSIAPQPPAPRPVDPPPSSVPTTRPPTDAPPGYEETQHQSIQAELDRRLSQS